ncbi:hypothetical protein BJ875DRAFT_472884 [Amylocarpus encephaloides]|uniref:RNA ligase domain-containing protein n=1 Tax=Amylocarpus encephaloides TaxID=45428 RepID=A0A9P8C1T1_9HELO|nr:hypothetical protein BJ875DRAFT_472884 [Amylocarpus encephaloides]
MTTKLSVQSSTLDLDGALPKPPVINEDPERPRTLFPKITDKERHFLREYGHKVRSSEGPTTQYLDRVIPLIGTVKLHGAHCDLVLTSSDELIVQSRNRVGLSEDLDAYDMAKTLLPLKTQILRLRDRYHERYKTLNPGVDIDEGFPTIIAGEWVGPGVQKTVAINALPRKCFVILSVSLNDAWLPDITYGDIHHEEIGIYHVSRGGYFFDELHLADIKASKDRLQIPTREVERECPFAKSFGLHGIGEGIVWKAEHPLGSDARFWIKTKGPLHRVTDTQKLGLDEKRMGGKKKALEFAKAAVTEGRMEQGWEYLIEMGKPRDRTSTGEFLKWVVNDVLVEEKGGIEELEVDEGLLKSAIRNVCKEWFARKLEEVGLVRGGS